MWLIRETDAARLYSKVRPDRFPSREDELWVPKSIIEHTTKRRDEHDVKLPEWFCAKNDL